jgi:hypothetical protein
MNRTEFKDFSERLFVAFPSFRSHINAKSDNPAGTLETWFKTLSGVELAEADAVVNSWLDGSVEPPKAFELDYVAILIRSRVGFKRNDRSRYETAKSLYEEQRAAKVKRESYVSPFADLEDMFEFAREVAARGLPVHEYNAIVAKEFYSREPKYL